MPSKKKKYNARFPPARIKKIMQTDEEVGKVAAAVPVIISRALELFVDSLVKKAGAVTVGRNAKTLTSSHIKACVLADSNFHFLTGLVDMIPDIQGDDEPPPVSFEGQLPSANSHHLNSNRSRKPKASAANAGDAGPSHPATADESETWSAEEDGAEGSADSDSDTTSDRLVVSSLPSSSIPPDSCNAPYVPGSFYGCIPHQVPRNATSSTDEDYDL